MKIQIIANYLLTLMMSTAVAAIELGDVREALPKKTDLYLKEGMFSGGDREIRFGLVKDVRRATNGGFERIVVDLDSEKAPYYQASIDPSLRRILVTIFGSPKITLDAKKIVDQFRKSSLVARVEFFPVVDEDVWTFALHLRAAVPVEVFELTAPTRIIFDLKGGAALMNELAPKSKTTQARLPVKRAALHAPARPKPVPAKRTPIRANPVEDEYEGNGASNHSEDLPE
jgi:hypothetical protein